MEKKLSFREQYQAFKAGAAEWTDNGCYLFYDWFCSEKALKIKSKLLMSKAFRLASKLNLDMDKNYVFLKNNCPMNGRLYDSFSFCDLETGDVQVWCTPSNGHNSKAGSAEVFTRETGFENAFKEANSWGELIKSL